MSPTRREQWERRLRAVFEAVDAALEEKYGEQLPRHPARPPHGRTANRKYDGLFEVDGKFSLGLGSGQGPGYVVEARVATLARVPRELRRQIEADLVEWLAVELARQFPGRELRVVRDAAGGLRIVGDLSL